ncbi:MAG TPA: alpha/beta hydrolase [Thermoanaerobaculia bacterium]
MTPYEEVRSRVPPERLVEAAGQTVYVEDRPAETALESAETVVLLHGFGASSYSWRRVTGELAGYRTVALDLRGFGYTERPPGIEPYTRQGQIDLVLAVMDELGIDRAHLVGHSYGGALAATLAARRPERVRSLTLVDAAHPEYPQRRRTRLASVRPLTELFIRVRALRPRLIRRALERSIADDSVVTDELVDAYAERLAIEHAPRAYYGITAPVEEPEEEISLGQVPVPTLVLWGEEDTLITVEEGREASRVIPCHRFVTIPGAGHLPMEERPAELAEALREFLHRPERVCDAP